MVRWCQRSRDWDGKKITHPWTLCPEASRRTPHKWSVLPHRCVGDVGRLVAITFPRSQCQAGKVTVLGGNTNKSRFLVNCICTRRARMTRRPPVSECRDETTCLRPNVPTGDKVSPDPTRRKARHSKWNCSDHFNQRQPTRNVRRTDATKSHCCRSTKSAPIKTPLTPWRAQKRQQ